MLDPAADPYARIAQDLGGRLVRCWPLKGGVSANVQVLELEAFDGTLRRVVVRQHGEAGWKPLEESVTSTEFGLMRALADVGLPVPRPQLLDLSGTVLPRPYLVLPFVQGTTELRSLPRALEKMAGFLARLHGMDVDSLMLPSTLPPREEPVAGILEYLPAGFDALRTLLAERGPKAGSGASVLHGDFWPGNLLWWEDEIAAVIDWEDAALGEPLSDLACCRVELLCAYGGDAMEAFTQHYVRARDQEIHSQTLTLWELYVASAALAFMDRWGLEPAVEAARRAATRAFLERAAERLLRGRGAEKGDG